MPELIQNLEGDEMGLKAQKYEPTHIVEILKNSFLRYRDLELTPSEALPRNQKHRLADHEIVNDMRTFGYVRINASRLVPRGKRDAVIFILLDADSGYSHSSGSLKKLITGIEGETRVKEGYLDEIIIIACEAFFARKNMTEVIGSYRSKNPKNSDPSGQKAFYNAYPYHVFSLVVPEHKAVPPHRILSQKEVAYLAPLHIEKNNISVILSDDPPIVWIGGRDGQIVEIERDSPITGKAIGFRRIVRTPRWDRNL